MIEDEWRGMGWIDAAISLAAHLEEAAGNRIEGMDAAGRGRIADRAATLLNEARGIASGDCETFETVESRAGRMICELAADYIERLYAPDFCDRGRPCGVCDRRAEAYEILRRLRKDDGVADGFFNGNNGAGA